MNRAEILVAAANHCIAKSSDHAAWVSKWRQVEFREAMMGYPIERIQARVRASTARTLAKAYTDKAIKLIKAI